MEFNDRLRQLRAEKGMTQGKLAGKIGISYGTIQAYERGQIPKGDYLLKLAVFFGVSIQWLLTGKGSKRVGEAFEDGEDSDYKKEETDLVRVSLYNAEPSAGGGTHPDLEKIKHFLSFRQDWVKNELRADPKDLVAVNVSGHSMEPTLRDRDTILVNKGVDTIKDNAIYVINVDGLLMVKRLERRIDGSVMIRADNKAVSSDQHVSKEEAEKLIIVGRVVWFARQI